MKEKKQSDYARLLAAFFDSHLFQPGLFLVLVHHFLHQTPQKALQPHEPDVLDVTVISGWMSSLHIV